MNQNYQVKKNELSLASASLRDAFTYDPLWNHIFLGPNKDLRMDAFLMMNLLYASKYGKVYATSSDFEGVMAWIPCEKGKMTLPRLIFSGAMMMASRLAKADIKKLEELAEAIDAHKHEMTLGKSYDHLILIGTQIKYQNQGYGKRLLEILIEKSDQEKRSIYLETESQESVKFYEKFGFEISKTLMFDQKIPLWLMMRNPK
jgi:ribosomal protein S18 acetylase RimI-like enzyme